MREAGWYWIKVYKNSDWVIAHFDEFWSLKRRWHMMCDLEIYEIDERRITMGDDNGDS